MITAVPRNKVWISVLESNNWTSALLTGKAFAGFVDQEFAMLRAIMVELGCAAPF